MRGGRDRVFILTNIQTLSQSEGKVGGEDQESLADVSHGSVLATSGQRFISGPSMSEALRSLIPAQRQPQHIKEKCNN